MRRGRGGIAGRNDAHQPPSTALAPLPFAVLRRLRTTEEGTFGFLRLATFHLLVGELPWRDNGLGVSCIPPGRYHCAPQHSESRGAHFRLLDVPGRARILIHAGTWCGDADRGLPTSTHGSLLPGLGVAELAGRLAMLDSPEALNRLAQSAPGGFTLYIADDTPGRRAGGGWHGVAPVAASPDGPAEGWTA